MNKEFSRHIGHSHPWERIYPREYRQTPSATQAAAWSELSGRWISDISIEHEVSDIYSAQSGGRVVEF